MFKPNTSATAEQFAADGNVPDTVVVAVQVTPAFINQQLGNGVVPFIDANHRITTALANVGISNNAAVLGFGTKQSISFGTQMLNNALVGLRQRAPGLFGLFPHLAGTIAVPPATVLAAMTPHLARPAFDPLFAPTQPVFDSPFIPNQPNPGQYGANMPMRHMTPRLQPNIKGEGDRVLSQLSLPEQPAGWLQKHDVTKTFITELTKLMPARTRGFVKLLTQLMIDTVWRGVAGNRQHSQLGLLDCDQVDILLSLRQMLETATGEEDEGCLAWVLRSIKSAISDNRFKGLLVNDLPEQTNTEYFGFVGEELVDANTVCLSFLQALVKTYISHSQLVIREQLVNGVLLCCEQSQPIHVASAGMRVTDSTVQLSVLNDVEWLLDIADQLFISRFVGSQLIGAVYRPDVEIENLVFSIDSDLTMYKRHMLRQLTAMQTCQSDIISHYRVNGGTSPLSYSTLSTIAIFNKGEPLEPEAVDALVAKYKEDWEDLSRPMQAAITSFYQHVTRALHGNAETHVEAAAYLKVILGQYMRNQVTM